MRLESPLIIPNLMIILIDLIPRVIFIGDVPFFQELLLLFIHFVVLFLQLLIKSTISLHLCIVLVVISLLPL